MGALTENPQLMNRVFVDKELNPQGIYGFQLCVDGEWKDIIIDDRLPCDDENKLVFSQASCRLFLYHLS